MICSSVLISVALLLLTLTAAQAGGTDLSSWARERLDEASARLEQQPASVEAGWQYGRAIFDFAEFSTNSSQRAALAEKGIAVCRRILTGATNSAAAHYYLAMNLGQLARTRGLGALKLVSEMEQLFQRACELDELFDYAGPDRNLGMLYRDAPVIASVGSRSKARKRLEQAVKLAPDFPENRLALVEGYILWGNRAGARREFASLRDGLAAGRRRFSGAEWASSWVDWDARIEKIRQKLKP